MKKKIFFRISLENVLIFWGFFFLGRFLSPHYVIGQASLLDCMPSVWRLNYAPSCACREMSQRLSRAPSNCGKSKVAWRSARICHILNLKMAMKKNFFFKAKTFFLALKSENADTKNFSFFFKNWNLLKKFFFFFFENESWQHVPPPPPPSHPTMKFLLEQISFCETTDCSYFGCYVILPMDFKARVVLSPALLLACCEPKGHIWYYIGFFPPIGVQTVWVCVQLDILHTSSRGQAVDPLLLCSDNSHARIIRTNFPRICHTN